MIFQLHNATKNDLITRTKQIIFYYFFQNEYDSGFQKLFHFNYKKFVIKIARAIYAMIFYYIHTMIFYNYTIYDTLEKFYCNEN